MLLLQVPAIDVTTGSWGGGTVELHSASQPVHATLASDTNEMVMQPLVATKFGGRVSQNRDLPTRVSLYWGHHRP